MSLLSSVPKEYIETTLQEPQDSDRNFTSAVQHKDVNKHRQTNKVASLIIHRYRI